ncbi:FtsX-like permease family protein [Deinococcus fonticola]|uniref:FtsX-like permease family protein n=1 Tax=Deinococcus fonticola TaxID=2528713 RepID=UPI001074A3CB|nr:ABC transporter permease [Deinococcus fonticola]
MFLAFRELKFNLLRSVLLGGISALLAFMVFMLLGLTRGLSEDSAAWMLNNPAATIITTKDASGNLTRSFISPEDITALQKMDAGAVPFAQSFVSFGVNTPDSNQLGAVMLGLEPESFLAPKLTEGTVMNAGSAVVDSSLKEDGVKVGDTIILKPSGEELKVVGFTEGARLNHQPVIFVTLDEWHTLNPRAHDTVSGVALQAQAPAPASLPEGLAAQTRSEALQSLPGYKEEQGSLLMIQVFLVAVSALVMAVFFYVMTLQKTAQFGLLKAIGAGMRTLAGSLVAQVLLLTLGALALAVAAMYGTTQVLPAGMPFALSWTAVAQASGLLLLVALLGGLLSLRTIAQADPLQALGQGG